jgi:hypothetical protein
MRRRFITLLAAGPSDTTAPTVTITCTQTGPTATSPLNFTFTLSEVSTDFALADITVGNGTAGTFAGSGTSYTCNVTPTAFGNVTVDIAGGAFHDAAGNGNTAATQFVIFYGVFNPSGLSDGALPAPWTGGATYAIATNKVTNTPVLGSELWDAAAAAFTSGTYAWTPYGSNTLANVGNALEITYVNHASGAYEPLNNAADLSSDLTLGTFYRFAYRTKVNTGTVFPLLDPGGANGSIAWTVNNTTLANYIADFRCGHASNGTFQHSGMGTGEVVTIDDLSLKAFTTSNLLAGVSTSVSNVQVKAGWTLDAGEIGGVFACADSATAPTYGYFCYLSNASGQLILAKLVAGVWTNLIRTTVTYSAGANVEIRRNGDTVQAYYNGSQVSTDQTVTDVGTNTIHGYFGTSGEAATFTVARFP